MKKLILPPAIFVFAGLAYGAAQLISHSSVQAAMVASVQSGDWSDPDTWSTGTVPSTGDMVTINAGHTVTYDVQSDAVLGKGTIRGPRTCPRPSTPPEERATPSDQYERDLACLPCGVIGGSPLAGVPVLG